MDAFLIVSTSGRIIIERYYKNGASRAWIDDYVAKLSDHTKQSWLADHVAIHPIVLSGDKAIIQILRNDVLLIGITKQEFPAVLLIETLHQVADHVGQHFDDSTISEELIKSHYSSVLSLIDEMLDYGLPSNLEPNALQMLVVDQSPLSKAFTLISQPSRLVANVISSTSRGSSEEAGSGQSGYGMGSGSGMGAGSGILGCGAAIWWRRGSGITPTNEVFLDLVERLSCIVDCRGKVLTSYLTGDITINSSLSGIPSFKLILKGLETMKQPQPLFTFHPSVNRQKWMQDQTMCCVPPDGKFTVCQYSMQTDLSPPLNVTSNFTFSDSVNVKDGRVEGATTSGVGGASTAQGGTVGKFELQLQPRQGFGGFGGFGSGADINLENVRLSILLPSWVTGVTTAHVSAGTVKFNDRSKTLTWSFVRFPLDTKQNLNPKCEGTLIIDENYNNLRKPRRRDTTSKQGETQQQQQKHAATTVQDDRSSHETSTTDDMEQDNHAYGYSHFPPTNNQATTTTAATADSDSLEGPFLSRPQPRFCLNPRDLKFPAFLTFWLPSHTLSHLSVDSLEISNTKLQNGTSVNKIIRCALTAGKIEFRL